MSQPSVTAYFNACKQPANEDLCNKSEVILLDQKYMKINEENKLQMRTQTFQTSKLLLQKQEETIVTSQKIMLILGELKASIDHIKKCDQHLNELQKQNGFKKPQIHKFEQIELEISIRTLNRQESINPIKNKLDKTPVYKRYLSFAEISAMLFNYKEIIFKKLKPAVQELLRRNFTLEYLVQIKTVYPNAYIFHQEFIKVSSKLVLTPTVQVKGGLNEPNGDNVLQAATNASMNKVKTEQEQFLLKLDEPIVILKQKIIRWHPEFDVESCKSIE
ncbi:DNA replication factor Cdt1-like [Vespula maculifrons]|uniref:DNA replication factor Cdt1-like n=1 Tax=Vespula maculifrons TaxID=7453 RepID=A0ABD2D437_VESMC